MLCRYAGHHKHRYYVWLNNYRTRCPWRILVQVWWPGAGSNVPVGICLRIVFGLHATWAVNSRNPRNETSLTCATIRAIPGGSPSSSFGEGWHNHHAHPTAARHGLAWVRGLTRAGCSIKVLKALGVARSIKVASIDSQLLSPDREAA